MSELPSFEVFTADVPSRRHPIERAKKIGAKAILLDGASYNTLPFSDDAKDSGVWLPKNYVFTMGRLRRLHTAKRREQLFASAEQSARDLADSSAELVASVERLTTSAETLLDVLEAENPEQSIQSKENNNG